MGQPLTLRTELSATPDNADLMHVVDVSDTTDSAGGTSKKVTVANLLAGATVADASTTVKGKVLLSTDAKAITGADTDSALTPANITAKMDTDGTLSGNSDTRIPSQKAVKTYVDAQGGDTAAPNLLKNGNFINNSTNGYGSTPDDWVSSNANPVQGGIPTLTKQELIDGLGIADGDIEGLWPLNEPSGNALDLSSNGYNLTDTNTVAASSDGLMASARDFESGNSEYFTIADGSAPNLELTGSQTMFGFVKLESIGSSIAIIGKSQTTTYRLLQVYLDNTAQILIPGLTTNTQILSDVKLEAGKWYFICGVYDSLSSKLKIWVNGIKKEVTASGTSTDTNGSFNIGRTGGTTPNYFDGLIQNVGVLSVALSDTQVKKLLAMTLYKGQKIRRATTNAIQYQDLPMDVVERLRGRTVALRADMYQSVASTGQISILQTLASGSTDETIISATDATTGSWLEKLATGTISATAVGIRIQLKHSTSDGNTWFENVSLYEGSTLLPYDHSKDDWSRFPGLLKIDIPAILDGYRFEEDKWMAYTVTGPTNTTLTGRFVRNGKKISAILRGVLTGAPSFAAMPSLPAKVGASAGYLTAGDSTACGFGSYLDSGTANNITGIVPSIGQGDVAVRLDTSGSAIVSASAPITWATNDTWIVTIPSYEID